MGLRPHPVLQKLCCASSTVFFLLEQNTSISPGYDSSLCHSITSSYTVLAHQSCRLLHYDYCQFFECEFNTKTVVFLQTLHEVYRMFRVFVFVQLVCFIIAQACLWICIYPGTPILSNSCTAFIHLLGLSPSAENCFCEQICA